jgi:transcriptional regulator with XRE-family HTH domain
MIKNFNKRLTSKNLNQVGSLRVELGITQEDLAFYLGMGRTNLSNIETQRQQMTSEAVYKLADLEKYISETGLIEMDFAPTEGHRKDCELRKAECEFQLLRSNRIKRQAEESVFTNSRLYAVLEKIPDEQPGLGNWKALALDKTLQKVISARKILEVHKKRVYLLEAEADYIKRILEKPTTNF